MRREYPREDFIVQIASPEVAAEKLGRTLKLS